MGFQPTIANHNPSKPHPIPPNRPPYPTIPTNAATLSSNLRPEVSSVKSARA